MLAFSIHKPHVNLNKKLAFLSSFHYYMGSKFLLKPTTSTIPTPLPLLPSSNKQQYRTFKRLSPVFCSSKPTSKFNRSLLTQTNGLPFSPLAAPGIYLMFFVFFEMGFCFCYVGFLDFVG
jgi:twinkle protein